MLELLSVPLWTLTGLVFIILILLLLLGVVMGIYLRRKYVVTVPSLTLVLTPVTPPGQYDHGQNVPLTGVDLLDVGEPAPGDTINLVFIDAADVSTAVGSLTAGSDGSYAGSFAIPVSAAPGVGTVTATDPKTGATASQTLTRLRWILQHEKKDSRFIK